MELVRMRFAVGADPQRAVRFLHGLTQTAPERLSAPGTRGVRGSPMRLAFAALRPQETARIAERIGAIYDGSIDDLEALNREFAEADLHAGLQMQRDLAELLRRDGLTDRIGPLAAPVQHSIRSQPQPTGGVE